MTDIPLYKQHRPTMYNEYNAADNNVLSKVTSQIKTIFDAMMSHGVNPREIAHMIISVTSSLEAEIVLTEAVKLRKFMRQRNEVSKRLRKPKEAKHADTDV